eukprot:2236593-Rhodomonas_salina.1
MSLVCSTALVSICFRAPSARYRMPSLNWSNAASDAPKREAGRAPGTSSWDQRMVTEQRA